MDFLKTAKAYAPVINLLLTAALFVLGYVLQSKTRRITSLMTWKSYRDDVRAFADRVIDVLSSLEGLCEANPQILKQEFWNNRNELISRLSALRDYGKLIIPNVSPGRYGQGKSAAYQGYRDRALDCLAGAFWIAVAINFRVAANNLDPAAIHLPIPEGSPQLKKLWYGLEKLPARVDPEGLADDSGRRTGWSCKSGIVEAKRQFVSEMQSLIDPRLWLDEIARFVPKRNS